MPSHFGWIDFTEQDRQQMLDVIQLFREPGTRDELGIGTIRDAFAGHFFPGTSTIQTRVRYMLFIPWIYRLLEDRRTSSDKVASAARTEEVRLINALIAAGEPDGVIGREARQKLQRLPSSVYWAGLGTWGIRPFTGSQDQYHRHLDFYYTRNRRLVLGDDREPLTGREGETWDPGLPPPPPDFPRTVSFTLTQVEARYLRERVITRHERSLLARLLDMGEQAGVGHFWDLPVVPDLAPDLQVAVAHARNFSETIYGAALLYNLMLAEARAQDDESGWVEEYRTALVEWAAEIDARRDELTVWARDPDAFEACLPLQGARVPYRTRLFVRAWLSVILDPVRTRNIADDPVARSLIADREVQLKGARSRLQNRRALELWMGAAGAYRLTYRWPIARTFLNEMVAGLAGEEEANA